MNNPELEMLRELNSDLLGGEFHLWTIRSIAINRGYTCQDFGLIVEIESTQTGLFKTICLTNIDCLRDVLYNIEH